MADPVMDLRRTQGLPSAKPRRSGARASSSTATTPSGSAICAGRAPSPTRIVRGRPDTSVVIISGSPVIGNFEFGSGVDYIRIPGVTKLPDGDYRSLNLNVDLDEAVGLRQAIILQAAKAFQPDVFIVDKEPTGFRGEVMPALEYLKAARLPPGARHPRRDGRARPARARMGAQGRRRTP